jgi:hypothetical protein
MRIAVGVLVSMVAASSGAAAGVSKGVPTTPMACVPDSPRLAGADGEAIVCWGDTCIRIDVPGTDAQLVPPPANLDAAAWGDQATVSDNQVCLGDRCKPLGPKLRAAVAAVREPVANEGGAVQAPPPVVATTDLGAVVIDTTPWSVARDQPLVIAPPSSYAKHAKNEYGMTGVTVVGALLATEWHDCAGPCAILQLVDSRGRKLGGELGGGGPFVPLDAHHFASVGESGGVVVLDDKGKLTGSFDIPGGDGIIRGAARLDQDKLAVLSQDPGGYRVTVAHIDDKGGTFGVDERTLPPCP